MEEMVTVFLLLSLFHNYTSKTRSLSHMPQIIQSQTHSGWKGLRGHLVKPLCSTVSPTERQHGERVAETAVDPLTHLLYLSQADGNLQPITISLLQKEHPRQRPTHGSVETDHTQLLHLCRRSG